MGKQITQPQQLTQSTVEKLKSFVQRIENVDDEIGGLRDDRKALMAEAKAFGLDPKIIAQVIRIRKTDRQKREEAEQIRDLYLHALGEIEEAPSR